MTETTEQVKGRPTVSFNTRIGLLHQVVNKKAAEGYFVVFMDETNMYAVVGREEHRNPVLRGTAALFTAGLSLLSSGVNKKVHIQSIKVDPHGKVTIDEGNTTPYRE